MSDGRFIYDLDQTSDQLGNNDKIIIEKADGSGTMIMTYSNFINSVTATILKNNGTTTASGYALDARYGKTLNDGTRWLYGVYLIPENTNLNSLTTVGEYYANNAAGSTASNTPFASAFRLTVEKMQNSGRNDIFRQTLRAYASSDIWIRATTNTGSSWSDWHRLAKQKNYTPTAGTNVTWSGYVQQVGNMVFVGGNITFSGNVAAGTALLSNLPASAVNNIVVAVRENTTGNMVNLLLTATGTVSCQTAMTSSSALRVAFCYPNSTNI